jgi:hypothetical protein
MGTTILLGTGSQLTMRRLQSEQASNYMSFKLLESPAGIWYLYAVKLPEYETAESQLHRMYANLNAQRALGIGL